jgi:hypothetical protein
MQDNKVYAYAVLVVMEYFFIPFWSFHFTTYRNFHNFVLKNKYQCIICLTNRG